MKIRQPPAEAASTQRQPRIQRYSTRTLGRWTAALLLALGATAAANEGGDSDLTGRRELQMEHCPSAVPGATTRIRDVADGVELTVTAPDDPIAQQEIRRRVQFQLEIVEQPERGAIEHTGLGTGSGRYGFCPGMLEHTTLSVEWTAEGARLTVRAEDAEQVAPLRAATHRRLRALSKRAHGPR